MSPEPKQEKISDLEQKVEASVEIIIGDFEKSSWRTLPQKQIQFIRAQVYETIQAYPPILRPFVATVMAICYFSIIPGAGTASLILFGGIGKILTKL